MKKMLAIAILTAAAGTANAQSSVTLLGDIGGGVRWVNGVKGGSQLGFDNDIIDGSGFTIKGTEDLGGNLKAIFDLESVFASGTGALSTAGTLFTNAAYVGITGNFGRITLGRQLSAFEDLAVVLDPSAARGALIAIVPAAIYGANFFALDTRFNNTVKYRDKVGGLTFSGSYSFGGIAGNTRAGSSFSAATLYQYQTLLVGAGYQKTYSANASQAAAVLEAGSALQLGAARLYLNYSDFSVTGASAQAPERRDRIPAGGIVYQVTPAFQVTVAFYDDIASNLSNVNGASGHKVTSYAIAEYFLSKRTELYAEVDHNGFSGAYKTDPTNVAVFNLSPGATSTTGISVGMMMQF
ncbi:porin [Paraburkholderia metrosideri]|uniref:Porin n=1 Tax=Paraburkholderia metrosideri TaxID=580937 RepID=A0ABW9E639_9BURK